MGTLTKLHPSDLRACSSVYGKITMVLLLFRGTAKEVDSDMIRRRFGHIFEAFGDRVTFVILANGVRIGDQKKEEELTQWFSNALQSSHLYPKHHVICVGTYSGDSAAVEGQEDDRRLLNEQNQWAQDAFVVLETAEGMTVLLEPMLHVYLGNALVAEQLASTANILLKPTRYRIEGGNILIGDDYALVGMDLLELNRKRFFDSYPLQEGRNLVTAEFKRLLGVKYLVWIGGEEALPSPLGLKQGQPQLQPLFHIDLFVTLGGKHPESGHEVVFVAKVYNEGVLPPDNAEGNRNQQIADFNTSLDLIADHLRDYHKLQPGPQFQVERMPMGIRFDPDGKPTILSYNNAHVEWYHGIRRIYLPSYPSLRSGPKPLEDRVEKLMKGLRYNHRFIDNLFEDYSRYENGSLHCLSKVLCRTSY